ncbi:PorT family protein [Hymenobacter sp. 5516J-16]|uniref:outer membrane beta-barrel protein n=1 Tax=Hymenobacter sp. 5516J-16 TaxID=2932253 RepID=UPI001FD15D11|nr:outer membrane beta-barrel protein [Hymenobacter sp. 5516J-16]UOQ77303.1 PorT family protein [Hymenobacter sp. 5516J-16]
MKRFFALLAFLLLTLTTASTARAAGHPGNDDTILVKLPNQATMTLYVKDKAQLRQMRQYKLDSLIVLLDAYITQAEAAGKNSKSEQVTLEFYPAKEQPGKQVPEQIRITVRNQGPGNQNKSADRVDVVLGRAFGVTVYDKPDDKEGVSVRISSTPDSVKEAQRKARQEERNNRAVHSNFNIDLGLNTLVNRETPVGGQDFDLRPIGSRYLSLNWHYDIRVGKKGSPLHLLTGPELAFNNYMLDKNLQFIESGNRTVVALDATNPDRELQKSKLAVSTINLPLVAVLDFKNKKGRDAFRIGAGGFVGYRLGSHTKIKYEDNGNTKKDKDRGSYNLADFQYGLQGTIGIRGLDLFAKYNLNETFKNNRGPQAQTLSFGVSLLQ